MWTKSASSMPLSRNAVAQCVALRVHILNRGRSLPLSLLPYHDLAVVSLALKDHHESDYIWSSIHRVQSSSPKD